MLASKYFVLIFSICRGGGLGEETRLERAEMGQCGGMGIGVVEEGVGWQGGGVHFGEEVLVATPSPPPHDPKPSTPTS